ncbi:hypothetical protein CAL28_17095 [Bordetella genomosp. 11]|uniref:Uncharacterized protein n=1 Tax=Bordetella genomosp. 11 TaxID=1416808 RepID=A0A261UJK8_9BORD|nr:hypothetical protein CAL28_17095 [Bordetella genomosp. 11]
MDNTRMMPRLPRSPRAPAVPAAGRAKAISLMSRKRHNPAQGIVYRKRVRPARQDKQRRDAKRGLRQTATRSEPAQAAGTPA